MARHLWRLSLLAFAASWCVPVTQSSGDLFGGKYRGWQAALFAISPLFGSDFGGSWLTGAFMVASALTNVLYLGAMVYAYRRGAAASENVGRALIVASLLNASWLTLIETSTDLRLGYYLWLLAFPLAAASVFVARRDSRTLT